MTNSTIVTFLLSESWFASIMNPSNYENRWFVFTQLNFFCASENMPVDNQHKWIECLRKIVRSEGNCYIFFGVKCLILKCLNYFSTIYSWLKNIKGNFVSTKRNTKAQ